MIFNILVFILSFMFCLTLSVALYPAQANCLSLGEINSSQLVVAEATLNNCTMCTAFWPAV